MKKSHFLVLISIPMVSLSCQRETVAPIVPATIAYGGLVDEALIPYFQRFEREAALRGVSVDLDAASITGAIERIDEEHVAGTCHYSFAHPNAVTIDLDYWNASSAFRREMVVFHELGHCYLGRDHLETSFDNNICTTIMNSGTSGCFVAYNSQNRDYYLDELFEQ